jgi:hypothetical protein
MTGCNITVFTLKTFSIKQNLVVSNVVLINQDRVYAKINPILQVAQFPNLIKQDLPILNSFICFLESLFYRKVLNKRNVKLLHKSINVIEPEGHQLVVYILAEVGISVQIEADHMRHSHLKELFADLLRLRHC